MNSATDTRPAGLRPHAELPEYYGTPEARREFLGAIFDTAAPDYGRIESVLGLGSGSWYRRGALVRAGLAPGMRVLDVAVGTGLVAREAKRIVGPSGIVVGVDPSLGMMAAGDGLAGVPLVQGRAEALPFADASFDFVSLGFALRHVDDVATTFREFRRVLRPGGQLVMLEITRPRSRAGRALLAFYMRGLVPLVSRALARRRETERLFRYYWDTIEACVPPATVLEALAAHGFSDPQRKVQLGIFSEYRATA
ncbi:MAG TPA: class I SAM-dependent methyltransferase [Burkholderiales bacterium]|nr:class I SAM-dependent methyltransferase [Burkholderiales bacterium]